MPVAAATGLVATAAAAPVLPAGVRRPGRRAWHPRRAVCALWLGLVAADVGAAQQQGARYPGRRSWLVTVDQLAAGHVAHPHVAVVGRVRLVRRELDGDLHIKLTGVRSFIVAECIPLLPCANPPLGRRILVHGIPRYDVTHRWWEIHPVEAWTLVP